MMEKTRVPNWYVVNGGMLEEVEQFCYLEDVLDCKAGVERAVRAQTWAVTSRLIDVLHRCDHRMLRYMSEVRW